MTKEQKETFNKLKKTLKEQFPYIRYVRREKETLKFFAGVFQNPIKEGDSVWDICSKLDKERGWIPLGVEMDLTPYKQFIEELDLGLKVDIVWHCPYITEEPYIEVNFI